MLLAPIPWAGRVWALPFLTALVPSERACRERGRRHKPSARCRSPTRPPGAPLAARARPRAGWRRQLLRPAVPRRDAPRRHHGDHPPAARCGALRTRPARPPGTIGRPRTKGARLPTLADVLAEASTGWQAIVVPGWYGAGERTHRDRLCDRGVAARRPARRADPMGSGSRSREPLQALPLCTDLDREPAQIVSWFVRRWSVEVTFQEARAHLGVETQRQWSDKAIARTTPCLLALFSIVTLLAARSRPANGTGRGGRMVPQTAPDLRRCPAAGALRSGASRLWQVTAPTRPNKTPLPFASALGLCPLPRRMIGQSRA